MSVLVTGKPCLEQGTRWTAACARWPAAVCSGARPHSPAQLRRPEPGAWSPEPSNQGRAMEGTGSVNLLGAPRAGSPCGAGSQGPAEGLRACRLPTSACTTRLVSGTASQLTLPRRTDARGTGLRKDGRSTPFASPGLRSVSGLPPPRAGSFPRMPAPRCPSPRANVGSRAGAAEDAGRRFGHQE